MCCSRPTSEITEKSRDALESVSSSAWKLKSPKHKMFVKFEAFSTSASANSSTKTLKFVAGGTIHKY